MMTFVTGAPWSNHHQQYLVVFLLQVYVNDAICGRFPPATLCK